jgi:hypothetical protein
MKVLLPFLLFAAITANSQEPKVRGQNPVEQQRNSEGKYHDEADSIRKKHLTPRYQDTVERSRTDRMPTIKSDTNKSDPNMPVARPKNDQHMPVKELSDTSNKK